MTITRSDSLIADGNSGQPFDGAKVDAITAIFKSDKTADECIGNKGIGFKAVFQIADSAEVYSSALGRSLADGCAIAFRIVRSPIDDLSFFEQMRALAEELLGRYADRCSAIENRFPDNAAAEITLQEAKRAAWFTFPLPSTQRHYLARIAELDLPEDVLSATQTLIVLPTDGSHCSCTSRSGSQ